MKQLAALFALFSALAFAEPSVLSEGDASVYLNMQQDDSARAYNSKIAEKFSEHIELAPSASFNKASYFAGELIVLDLNIKSSHPQEFRAELQLGMNTNMKLLKIEDLRFENNSYKGRVFLQALNANAQISSLDIALFRAAEQVASAKLLLNSPQIKELPHEKNFSGVVAQNLELKDFKCTPYDDLNIICSATLQSEFGALDNFTISDSSSTSLSANNRDYLRNQAYAAMIFAQNKKSLQFSYFRPSSNSFEQLHADIVVASEEVSTQSDLAPNAKRLNYALQLGCLVLAVICVGVVLYFRRFYGLLAAAAVFAGVGLLDSSSFSTATLRENAQVKILPTANATVFERTSSRAQVKVLAEYGEYKKIQLPDDKIGWVQKEFLLGD